MAETISATTFPVFHRFSTDANANDLTQVNLPARASKVTIGFPSAAGKVTHTGTDGEAIGAHYWTVSSGGALELDLHPRTPSRGKAATAIYVASATSATPCEIIVEGG